MVPRVKSSERHELTCVCSKVRKSPTIGMLMRKSFVSIRLVVPS